LSFRHKKEKHTMRAKVIASTLLIVSVLLGASLTLSACTPVAPPEAGAAAGTTEAAAGQAAAPGPLTALMHRWQNMQAQQQGSNPMPMAEMMGQMGALLGEMQAMLASQPDAGVDQTMMDMLGQMMKMAEGMMAQMQSLPPDEQQVHMPHAMALMGQTMALMGQLQGTLARMGPAMPMTATIPMAPDAMGPMMDKMMAMMSGTVAITDTMPVASIMAAMMSTMMNQMQGMMGATMPLTGTMPMGQGNMGQMMSMMGLMMQMMGHMQQMMAGGTGMMGAGMPMTGTMPMGHSDMGQMMSMMGQMMQMMMTMHQTMMGGGMGPMAPAGVVTPTTPVTQSVAPSLTPTEAIAPTQTFQAGNVTVSVRPLNLGAELANTLDFQVTLETHSGSLDFDLAELAVLRVGDAEIAASSWEALGEGHHVNGILSFPTTDAAGKSVLGGAAEVSVVIRNLPGVEEHVLTWPLAGSAMTDSSLPFDAQFIDSMIEHHEGAIAIAKAAQAEAEHGELKQLADAIIAAQTEEIGQMTEWRTAWYPDLAPTEGLGMVMGDMLIGGDENVPFDQRFIEAMIAHHQGAIEMAQEAQAKAEHEEIKQLADAIIAAQQAEIEQMQGWQKAWHE
jgi:uncharacterized protein (DUF305 family)